jgi:glycosyltransferase involved in cell wall biosynthesis
MLNKLTFAIPIYISTPRIEQYLHECIQSIIDQSDENWELLISNDCSPIKIDLSRYTDKRIKIFTQEKNI